MDWFTWLSKTGLDRSLIYEYTLTFSRNQLDEEDLPYLNHEFLQSMGIQVAKHRLEILKLARKKQNHIWVIPKPLARLILAIKKTKKCVTKRIRMWGRRKEPRRGGGRAIVRSYRFGSSRRSFGGGSIGSSSRWKAAMLKRSQRFTKAVGSSNRYSLTNGSFRSIIAPSSRIDSFSSSILAYHVRADQDDNKDHQGELDEYWSTPFEDTKLNPIVQNLKPT